MSSSLLSIPERLHAPRLQQACLQSGAGMFLRLSRHTDGGDLLLELGQPDGQVVVRTPYSRFTPISCARPWTIAENPPPLEIVSLESHGDELTVTTRALLFEITDHFGFQGEYLLVRRRWRCIASQAIKDVAVGTALCAANGVAQRVTIPNVLYNNNPSAAADRLVPHLRDIAGEALVVEEHRLPIPGVNVEWRQDQRHIALSLLVEPTINASAQPGMPECWSVGVISRRPGIELVSLSGVVALNGAKDHVYGAQNRAMQQASDGYHTLEPGQVLEKTIYVALTSDPAEGRGFRSLVSAGWELLQPRARPCFSIDKTIELKLNALRGRWREKNGHKGFIWLPEPGQPGNVYSQQPAFLYGWTGQSLRLAWCALEASARGFAGPWAEMGCAVLDHFASAPSLANSPGCRLTFQTLGDGVWHGSEGGLQSPGRVSSRALGESLTSLADCLLLMRRREMPIAPQWREALADGTRFLMQASLTAEGIFPAEFDASMTANEPLPSVAGVTCVMAMLAAAKLFEDRTLLDRACALLDRYAEIYTMDFRRPFNGATLDAACEDKEAGLYFFLANARAFQMTRRPRFAEQAALAADWTATFIYHWDVPMRPGTICAEQGFRTALWPGVSVQNMHLDVFHAPYELFAFARDIGNDRLMQMALGMMQAWTHGIAQYPGHWGYDIAGEQAEQFFQTNYIQGPGGPELWRGGFNPWNPSWIIANVLDAAMKFAADTSSPPAL